MSLTFAFRNKLHLDNDCPLGFIAWFRRGNCSGKNLGSFLIPTLGATFQPQQGTVLLFDASTMIHGTAPPKEEGPALIGSALWGKKDVYTEMIKREKAFEVETARLKVEYNSGKHARGKGKKGV